MSLGLLTPATRPKISSTASPPSHHASSTSDFCQMPQLVIDHARAVAEARLTTPSAEADAETSCPAAGPTACAPAKRTPPPSSGRNGRAPFTRSRDLAQRARCAAGSRRPPWRRGPCSAVRNRPCPSRRTVLGNSFSKLEGRMVSSRVGNGSVPVARVQPRDLPRYGFRLRFGCAAKCQRFQLLVVERQRIASRSSAARMLPILEISMPENWPAGDRLAAWPPERCGESSHHCFQRMSVT